MGRNPIVKKRHNSKRIHPSHLAQADLEAFLINELGITPSDNISPQYFALPTAKNQPLPSPELSRYLEAKSEEYEEF